MRKTLLISHGGMAKGMLNTLGLFIGDLTKDYTAISAYVDGCENPQEEVDRFFEGVTEDDQVLIFSDIMGGSVNQVVFPLLARKNTYIFSGMNLPMLIQASCLPEDFTADDLRALAEAGKEGVVYMNEMEMPTYDEDDE